MKSALCIYVHVCMGVCAILDKADKEGLSHKVTFDQGPQGGEEARFVDTWGESSMFRGFKAHVAFVYFQKVRRPLWRDPRRRESDE